MFACPLGRLPLAVPGPDGPGVLVIRPEAIRLDGDRGSAAPATVLDVRFRGTHHLAGPGEVVLTASVPPDAPVAAGDVLCVQLPPSACRVLPVSRPLSDESEETHA